MRVDMGTCEGGHGHLCEGGHGHLCEGGHGIV